MFYLFIFFIVLFIQSFYYDEFSLKKKYSSEIRKYSSGNPLTVAMSSEEIATSKSAMHNADTAS